MGLAEMKFTLYQGDVFKALKKLPDESVDCVVTSPPYWGMRDYQVDGQIGIEQTPEEYTNKLVEVFREVRRVLKKNGTCWLNLGDSYFGSWGATSHNLIGKAKRAGYNTRPPSSFSHPVLKNKDLIGIPWLVAFALQRDGRWLRNDIIWSKPNPTPESMKDRCTKSHEYIFLLTKSKKYYFDNTVIMEKTVTKDNYVRNRAATKLNNTPGKSKSRGLKTNNYQKRNKRTVWTISTRKFKGAHFATFPPELPELCIKAGCPKDGVVLDPFLGSGTTLMVARNLGRSGVGIELNPAYVILAKKRVGWNCGLDVKFKEEIV